MSSGSVSFDRAADYYDKTRSLAPEVWSRVISMLLGEISGRGLVLEVGVGTGRVGLPVSAAGPPLVGIDISLAMMAKIREKSGGSSPFPLAAADATAMPFDDGAFHAAYLVHVLHLIPSWKAAVTEILRVVRRPGIILVDPGSMSQRGMPSLLSRRFAHEAGSTLEKLMPGLFESKRLDELMTAAGATLRMLPEMTISRERTIRDYVEDMATGSHAFTWSLDPKTRRKAGEQTLAWAQRRWGSVDAPRRMRWRIAWRAYDLH